MERFFLNEMDPLAVRKLSSLRQFIPICDDALSFDRRRSHVCVMESLLKNLALLFTSGPLLDTLRTRAVSLMRAYCCSIGWVPKKLLSLSCP